MAFNTHGAPRIKLAQVACIVRCGRTSGIAIRKDRAGKENDLCLEHFARWSKKCCFKDTRSCREMQEEEQKEIYLLQTLFQTDTERCLARVHCFWPHPSWPGWFCSLQRRHVGGSMPFPFDSAFYLVLNLNCSHKQYVIVGGMSGQHPYLSNLLAGFFW